jgi:CDGSH-type Zn-finger protein
MSEFPPGDGPEAPGGTSIVPYPNGPYVVRGDFSLSDQDGNPIALNRRTIALCRCGKSRMKPFCDGTHKHIRFEASSSPEPWPPEAGT